MEDGSEDEHIHADVECVLHEQQEDEPGQERRGCSDLVLPEFDAETITVERRGKNDDHAVQQEFRPVDDVVEVLNANRDDLKTLKYDALDGKEESDDGRRVDEVVPKG